MDLESNATVSTWLYKVAYDVGYRLHKIGPGIVSTLGEQRFFFRIKRLTAETSQSLKTQDKTRPDSYVIVDDDSDYHGHLLSDYEILFSSDSEKEECGNQTHVLFLEFWRSQFWITYRHSIEFVMRSDTGWGCMHRVGQMILARALSMCMLGPKFRLHSLSEEKSKLVYKELLFMFDDTPSAPFSLPNICRAGTRLGIKIGNRFTPTNIAQALQMLNDSNKKSPLSIKVARNTVVDIDELLQHGKFHPTVLFVALKLGTEYFHRSYSSKLVDLFSWPCFLGIAGGKKNSALYFTAAWTKQEKMSNLQVYQTGQLLYLDPHYPQKSAFTVNVPNLSFHTNEVRALELQIIDPSMLLGFMFLSENDLMDFVKRCQSWKVNPLFSIQEEFTWPASEDDFGVY